MADEQVPSATPIRDALAFTFWAHEWCWDDMPTIDDIPRLYERWLRDWLPEKELENGNYEARDVVEQKYALADAVLAARIQRERAIE